MYDFTMHDAFASDVLSYDALVLCIDLDQLSMWPHKKFDYLMNSLVAKGKVVWSSGQVQLRIGAHKALVDTKTLNCGLIDTFVYNDVDEFEEGFKKTCAFQPRTIKHVRGGVGKGIWRVWLQSGDYPATIFGECSLVDDDKLKLLHIDDNHVEYKNVGQFLKFCAEGPDVQGAGLWKSASGLGKYFAQDHILFDQRFLPRFTEGEVRMVMTINEPLKIILKKPSQNSIVAEYKYFEPPSAEFAELEKQFVVKDVPRLMAALGLANHPLPLLWTADFIPKDAEDGTPGATDYVACKFDCSSIDIVTKKADANQIAKEMGAMAIEWLSHAEPAMMRPVELASEGHKCYLLILNLHGVLCSATDHKPVLRPGCEEFLAFAFAHFEVAVWTSQTQDQGLLEDCFSCIFGQQRGKLLFEYTAAHCTSGDRPSLVRVGERLSIKALQPVWREFPQFTSATTLLVDTQLEVFEGNPLGTCALLPSWTTDTQDDALLAGAFRAMLLDMLTKGDPPKPDCFFPREHLRESPPRTLQLQTTSLGRTEETAASLDIRMKSLDALIRENPDLLTRERFIKSTLLCGAKITIVRQQFPMGPLPEGVQHWLLWSSDLSSSLDLHTLDNFVHDWLYRRQQVANVLNWCWFDTEMPARSIPELYHRHLMLQIETKTTAIPEIVPQMKHPQGDVSDIKVLRLNQDNVTSEPAQTHKAIGKTSTIKEVLAFLFSDCSRLNAVEISGGLSASVVLRVTGVSSSGLAFDCFTKIDSEANVRQEECCTRDAFRALSGIHVPAILRNCVTVRNEDDTNLGAFAVSRPPPGRPWRLMGQILSKLGDFEVSDVVRAGLRNLFELGGVLTRLATSESTKAISFTSSSPYNFLANSKPGSVTRNSVPRFSPRLPRNTPLHASDMAYTRGTFFFVTTRLLEQPMMYS